ncbi:AraC family transcriptional regulator [Caulobacter sp. D4A]|uniref:helix-turn-helix domain-containing protein n=1 Tax=unclassified Caulobacter TaxID=2648921 RepID=UPI000D73E2E7|nr:MULTISPECIES: AraC family transcriptional regulator [unclassified Caulobacter]PXA95115.1 AraC family transcriptional regulator [Caulobacter sp. D5]PXA95707.1 AraC family transcriptional regulator [Caulobacter sp. D4A]
MPISTVLSASPDHKLVLSHYEPGEESRAHRHDCWQVSLLLAGGYVEDSLYGSLAVDRVSLSRKPSGFEHQNLFGTAGALILSVHGDAGATPPHRYQVATCSSRQAGQTFLEQAAAEDGRDWGAQHGADRPACIPAWLNEARHRLVEMPRTPIARLARDMERHPSAFARAFRAAFGRTPAQLRQDWRVASAIDRIIRSDLALAEVASASGFADQAHMTRAVTATSGWSPGALRRLLRR